MGKVASRGTFRVGAPEKLCGGQGMLRLLRQPSRRIYNMDDDCIADLKLLERELGRDLMTGGYTKFPRMISIIKGMQEPPQSMASSFCFAIRVIILTVRRRLVAPV